MDAAAIKERQQPLAEEWGDEEIVRDGFGDLAARRAPPPSGSRP